MCGSEQMVLIILLQSLIAVLIFTGLDYYAHTIYYTVPTIYFTNKMMYGTAIVFIFMLFMPKGLKYRNIIIGVVTSALLQINYISSGYYPVEFHFIYLPLHTLFLALSLFIVERVIPR